METTAQLNDGLAREIEELLETAGFSLETVRMALSIGRRARNPRLSLDDRLATGDAEEREAGMVAVEALDHARAAYLELAHRFDQDDLSGMGYDIKFWSTFEWCWTRLFTEPVRATGTQVLRHELIEAMSRTTSVTRLLRERSGPVTAPIH